MTNKTKIVIAILVVIAIVIAIFGIISTNKNKQNKNKQQEAFDQMVSYMNNLNEKKTENNIQIENNIVDKNLINNNSSINNNNNKVTNEIQTNNTIIGKEEQESNSENTKIDNEQKAIELAQKEWGISITSYKFEANLQNDGTYEVKVYNKTDTSYITTYIVNVETEKVTEK